MPVTYQYRGAYKKKVGRTKKAKPLLKKPAAPLRYQIADTAYKAFKGAQYLKGLINVERKHFDTQTVSGFTNTGTTYTLNNMGQGTTDQLRNGDSILMKSINVSGVLERDTTTPTDTIARVLVVRDKQNTTGLGDILEYTGGGSVSAPHSPYNTDKAKQFVVHYDKTFLLNAEHPHVLFNFSISGLDKHTQFEAASGTINSNAYKIYLYSTIAVNQPIVTYVSRATYYDN